jgi:teichuronic acid biosynthesis glycosyltransferase TuaG
MIKQPLVSIITPAYNAERFIKATIESVINQTYTNWEMLIVNDCSKDSTTFIVQEYVEKDSRIILINAPQNGGVAAARNLALERAKGKYIAFVDSDDCWHPKKLEIQINFMQERNIAFSYTSYQLIDENGTMLNRYVHAKPTMKYNNVLKNTLIGCLTVVVNVEKTGGFRFPPLTHTEDTMAWVEVLRRGFVAYGILDVLSYYRISSNSMTSRKPKMAKLQWKTYREYCGYGVIRSVYYFTCYAINALLKIKNAKVRTKEIVA